MFEKKQVDAIQNAKNVPADRMASLIAGAIKKIQAVFVQVMTALFQKIGIRLSKIVFVIVLTATCLYSLYLTGTALFNPEKSMHLFRPATIQHPKNIQQVEFKKPATVTDTITAEKLRAFTIYFDSIKTNQPMQYDSILQSRPGLMDSVRMLTRFYYSQQKHEAYEK